MVNIEKIQRVVAAHFGVTVGLLRGPYKHATVSLPRHVAMYLCRICLLEPVDHDGVYAPLSYAKIARAFRREDHTTAIHACRRMTYYRSTGLVSDEALRDMLRTIWTDAPQVTEFAVFPVHLFRTEGVGSCVN